MTSPRGGGSAGISSATADRRQWSPGSPEVPDRRRLYRQQPAAGSIGNSYQRIVATVDARSLVDCDLSSGCCPTAGPALHRTLVRRPGWCRSAATLAANLARFGRSPATSTTGWRRLTRSSATRRIARVSVSQAIRTLQPYSPPAALSPRRLDKRRMNAAVDRHPHS